MLTRVLAALMMVLVFGLSQSGLADATGRFGNPANSGFEVAAAVAVDQDQHQHPAGAGGVGNCHHASIPCAPSFLFQRVSMLDFDGSSRSWTMPNGADLKPVTLTREPPIPRPAR